MPKRRAFSRPGLATGCAVLIALLLFAGALVWYRPFLTTPSQPVAEIPAPPALFVAHQFPLAGHQQACMDTVTVTPQSQLVSFSLFPGGTATGGGPPVLLTLTAPGYAAKVAVPGGYPGGSATLPLSPPKHPRIVTACFHNLGAGTVLLVGTSEPRTVSRSHLTVDRRAVYGDVALSFLESKRVDLLQRLGPAVQHASDLTDGLLPPALIWIVAVATALGVPLAMILAFHTALREQPPAG